MVIACPDLEKMGYHYGRFGDALGRLVNVGREAHSNKRTVKKNGPGRGRLKHHMISVDGEKRGTIREGECQDPITGRTKIVFQICG